MTIEQTIEIPADHRLKVDVPREVPAGAAARFELTWFPPKTATEIAGKPARYSPPAVPKDSPTPHSDRLLGILSHLGDISLEELRELRLRKYQ
jgi:hypothetical protein